VSVPEEAEARLAERLGRGSVVVGVGNELRGDDGAGAVVARELWETVPWPVIQAETAPESFLMKIVSLEPDSVVVVDAIHLGAEPGSVRLLTADQLTGQGPSTHGPAPLTFLDALRALHPCRQAVLGIQPQNSEFGAGLSEPVRRAVGSVVEIFRRCAADAHG
jgi:hydrogenase 3 maturation protease